VQDALANSCQRSPPPNRGDLSRWEQLPGANRQRLLWLLSQLLERQLSQRIPHTEASHDAAVRGQ
jgi:hypothetical protein